MRKCCVKGAKIKGRDTFTFLLAIYFVEGIYGGK